MGTSRQVVLVKLGGSLITDKRRPGTARQKVIERLAGELARAARGATLVVGHGSGSYGHPEASRGGIGRGRVSRRGVAAVAAVQRRAAALHRRVMEALGAAGAPAFSLAPSSYLIATGGRPATLALEPLTRALELGLLPVTYGDVVMDRRLGAAICSTETLFVALARALPRGGFTVRRALWLGDTDGVYDEAGRLLKEIAATGPLPPGIGGASGTDVTGGMRHRVESARALARIGVVSWIGSGLVRGRMSRALRAARARGTLIRPGTGGA